MTPCLFSATHWYMPESDRFNEAMERAPFSICMRPCGVEEKTVVHKQREAATVCPQKKNKTNNKI